MPWREPERLPRVLVADDDRLIRMLTRETLLQANFEVIEAADGREALDLFAQQPSDLVLLDVDMPHLDGFQVCTAIRARADGAQVPVVMVTGMDDLDSITRAYQSGATDFISKPINWPVLGHRARYALRSAQAMAELRDAKERNAAMLHAIPDMMFALDEVGTFLDYKAGHGLLPLVPPQQFLGRSIAEVLPADVAHTVLEGVRQAVRTGELQHIVYSLETTGTRLHYEARVARAGPHRALALVRDISSQKEHEEKIRSLAYYDSLTGLPNRQSFIERLERELRQNEGGRLAVLFMDLDGFKRINDTLGHNAGDYLLQSVAARLKDGLRDSDIVARAVSDQSNEIFARLGGDEFTVIVPYIRDMEAVGALADRIRSLVGHPFIIQGREIVVTASIGIAVYPEDGGDAATLLKHADTAMYQAKDEGRNNWKTYSTALTTRAMHRLEMENSLRRGLERQEFCLYYQPQMRAADGRIDSVEALVRWNHPERGLVPPNEFIPIAEEGALIIPLGEWVLREALAQVRAWHKMGHSNLRVAVNLSGRQLRDANFVASVLQNLRATAFDGRFLELELTETILMDSTESTIGRLKQLSEAGVHFSIDDFGTGYSSMGYLKRFPIQLLKIDRSFVQGLPHNPDDVAIATAIISMAHSLHLEVVAEGVETPEQAEFLRRAGCEKLQGYLFSRPQPAAQIPALLAHGLTEATA